MTTPITDEALRDMARFRQQLVTEPDRYVSPDIAIGGRDLGFNLGDLARALLDAREALRKIRRIVDRPLSQTDSGEVRYQMIAWRTRPERRLRSVQAALRAARTLLPESGK